eukprot:204051_1
MQPVKMKAPNNLIDALKDASDSDLIWFVPIGIRHAESRPSDDGQTSLTESEELKDSASTSSLDHPSGAVPVLRVLARLNGAALKGLIDALITRGERNFPLPCGSEAALVLRDWLMMHSSNTELSLSTWQELVILDLYIVAIRTWEIITQSIRKFVVEYLTTNQSILFHLTKGDLGG